MQWERLEEQTSRDFSPTKEKSQVDSIQQTKAALDETIQQLNNKLHEHFSQKEQALIEQYKQELIEAQRELNELKTTTNQEQIKNKMLERKKQLQRQRHHLIQTNIFFSSKCEEYKRKLTDLIAEGKQLERELLFLDSQLNSTNRRKYQVLGSQDRHEMNVQQPLLQSASKQETQGSLPLLSDRKPAESARKLANSISVKSTNKKAIIEESLISKPRKNLLRGQVPNSVLQKTPLEQLFEATVDQIREKRKGKKGMPYLKGQQFSDYEKKMIMQQFLSKEEVKKKIFEIIFENNEKKPFSSAINDTKIKISYEDIS